MARMYPSRLDDSTQSQAERRLYEAFRDRLDSTYVVFHHVAWLSPDRRKQPRDGEADFVLAHPERGILVLEVKGGGIRRDPRSGTWRTRDAQGHEEVIRNPIEQAKDSKFTLLAQLHVMLPSRYIPIDYAVAFPDLLVTEGNHLGPDLPRDILLDATDIPTLAQWVENTFAFWRGPSSKEDTPLGAEGIQALITLLGKQWELRPALWGQFLAEDEQFVRLTEEQYRILDSLNYHRRMAICGFAGSGKTMIAVEKATRLAKQGFEVLLVCYNRSLADDLREHLHGQARLTLSTFHEVCLGISAQAGIIVSEEATRRPDYYNHILPHALLEAVNRVPTRYDAIIVDEGQDFLEDWWTPLQLLLADPDQGILYYEQIQRDDLPRHRKRFKELLNDKIILAISMFKETLDMQRDEIEANLARLNESLRSITYTPSTYIQLCHRTSSDPQIKEFHFALRACLPDVSQPQTPETNEISFRHVQALIEHFEQDERWTSKVTDVRNWMTFWAEELYREDGSRKNYYDDSSGLSGGQKAKLASTILASAIAYQYGLNQDESSQRALRFIVIDEAFSRSDEMNARYAMDLFKQLDLQVLVVTPLEKLHIVESYINACHYATNTEEGDDSKVYNLTIEEYHCQKQSWQGGVA